MTFNSFSDVDDEELVMAEDCEVMEAVATMVAILEVTLDVEENSRTLSDRFSSLPRSSRSLLLSLEWMGSICLSASARSSLDLMGSTCLSASARSARWCSVLKGSALWGVSPLYWSSLCRTGSMSRMESAMSHSGPCVVFPVVRVTSSESLRHMNYSATRKKPDLKQLIHKLLNSS